MASLAAGQRQRRRKVGVPGEYRRSRPISRVLSGTAIHLGRTSPCASSDLPGSTCGPHAAAEAARSPIWSCSGWGLPCRRVLPPARCALTAPFHPCRPLARGRRCIFCGTFRGLAPPRRYLAPCPAEPGLSSTRLAPGSGCPAGSVASVALRKSRDHLGGCRRRCRSRCRNRGLDPADIRLRLRLRQRQRGDPVSERLRRCTRDGG